MNTIDFFVTKILSSPYFAYNKWWIKVMAESHGVETKHTLMFTLEEQAKSINVGYKFIG